MSAPFRIVRPDEGVVDTARKRQDDFNSYLDRLLKMIPAEVVSLYLVGSALIPKEQAIALAVWAVVCLAGVVIVRAYGTADPENQEPTDWVHVLISSIGFVIWVYTLGGPFAAYNFYIPWLGSLLVLVWTFFVPILYKGPKN